MVILNEGIDKIRDLINTNLTKGQNGTGTGTADAEDSGLEIEIGTTLLTLSINISKGLLTTTHTLTTTQGNGNNFTEFENQFSDGVSINRIRHTSQSKTNTKEMRFIVTYEITGG